MVLSRLFREEQHMNGPQLQVEGSCKGLSYAMFKLHQGRCAQHSMDCLQRQQAGHTPADMNINLPSVTGAFLCFKNRTFTQK
jgi:hypothetical protein